MRVPLPISCRAGRCPKVLMRYSLYWRQYLTQRVAEEIKMEINDDVLLKCAIEATKKARQVVAARQAHYWQFMGYVGAALATDRGNVYTGINITLICGIGFCAEHSAVA